MADQFGRVDIVVANVGIALAGPTADADPQAFCHRPRAHDGRALHKQG